MFPSDRPLKILVAGAGINGLMITYLLLKNGAHVFLCDSGPIPNPGAASHGRHRLIHPWQHGDDGRIAADAEYALCAWQKILEELGCEGLEMTGILVHGRNNHTAAQAGGKALNADAAEKCVKGAGLDRGHVASNVWTKIECTKRVQRIGRCTVATSDNGIGFKFAPIAANEAVRLMLSP